jgi:chemotaxis protein MotB
MRSGATRRRKALLEEDHSRDRWLVSYADFITLMFAFFVVMYAISSINEGKYRVLTESLTAVFAEQPRSKSQQFQAVPSVHAEQVREELPEVQPLPVPPTVETDEVLPEDESIEALEKRLEISLEQFKAQGLVEIERKEGRIEVRMKSKMLFESGSARLSNTVLRALRDVGRILQPLENPIRVEGHTDDVPINTIEYPSNWELSAARAASVVHFFSRIGVPPDRLAAVGFGEHRPLADNSSEDGRAANRRVTLVIDTRPSSITKIERPTVPWTEGPNFEGNP